MATRTIAGNEVEVNEEGFMIDPSAWNNDIALEIAKEEGIAELSAEHWKVINYCRQAAVTSGKAPTLRNITNNAGVSTKDLFSLFPKGPAKKVARIAGLAKPEGCV
jgi:tRNA 2-thiouridine synthesizing protein E